jgi:hypothetical protein
VKPGRDVDARVVDHSAAPTKRDTSIDAMARREVYDGDVDGRVAIGCLLRVGKCNLVKGCFFEGLSQMRIMLSKV